MKYIEANKIAYDSETGMLSVLDSSITEEKS